MPLNALTVLVVFVTLSLVVLSEHLSFQYQNSAASFAGYQASYSDVASADMHMRPMKFLDVITAEEAATLVSDSQLS